MSGRLDSYIAYFKGRLRLLAEKKHARNNRGFIPIFNFPAEFAHMDIPSSCDPLCHG